MYFFSAVYIIFLFAAIFAVIAIVYFAIGTLSQRAVCDTLRNPDESNIIDTVEKLFDMKQFNITANITSILDTCHKNESIYKVFQLGNTFDLSKLKNFAEEYNIDEILEKLHNDTNFDHQNIIFLSDEGKEQLKNLINSGISDINYDKFIDEVYPIHD